MYISMRHKKELSMRWITSTVLALSICLSVQASCPDMSRYWEKILKKEGFVIDKPEQIIEATKSESYFTRYIALKLLTHRIQQQAVPTLRQALEDKHILVRFTSAHLLGTLGNKSGLERMRLDFAELVPRGGAAEPPDPNIAKDANGLKQWQSNRWYRIRRALEVAKVLAELGDRRGYALSAKIALESPAEAERLVSEGQDRAAIAMSALRSLAVEALGEIAKTDKDTLAAEGREPVAVLCAVVASEKRKTVFKRVVMAAEKIRGDIGIQILEKAKDNPHQSEQDLRRVKGSLGRLKAAEKKRKSSGG